MPRFSFGGGASDFVSSNGRPRAGVTVTFWSGRTGGVQYTDLLDDEGNAISSLLSGVDGQIPVFQGPDGVVELWALAGGGRVRLDAYDDEIASDNAIDARLGVAIAGGSVETPAAAQAKAAAAQEAAETAAAALADAAQAAAEATASATFRTSVTHGSTAGTARPNVPAGQVDWTGSVAPTNATTGDRWWDTTAELVKRRSGAVWIASGNATYAKTAPRPINVLNRADEALNALGNGSGALLSSRFGSLAEAQAKFPFATSLTWSIDRAALQSGINTHAAEVPPGTYVCDDELALIKGLRFEGTGSYHESILSFPNATRGLALEGPSYIEGAIRLANMRVIGNPSALDLITLDRVSSVEFHNLNVRTTSKSCFKLTRAYKTFFTGYNRLESFAEYGVHGYLCNAWSYDGIDFAANAQHGIACVYVQSSGFGTINKGNFEGAAAGIDHAVLLNDAHRVNIADGFMEYHTGQVIRAFGVASSSIHIERNHLHSDDSVMVDFSEGALAHGDIRVLGNRAPLLGTGAKLFSPGSTTSWSSVGNTTEGALLVVGHTDAAALHYGDVTRVGALKFGATGDVNLYRNTANGLKTDDDFYTALDFTVRHTAASQVTTGARGPAGQAGVAFGSANDVNLYRRAADQLKTDDRLLATGGIGVGNSALATTLGTVVRRVPVYNEDGGLLGYAALFDNIT